MFIYIFIFDILQIFIYLKILRVVYPKSWQKRSVIAKARRADLIVDKVTQSDKAVYRYTIYCTRQKKSTKAWVGCCGC